MKVFSEEDIKVGLKLLCTKSTEFYFTVGKIYTIEEECEDEEFAIIDDYERFVWGNWQLIDFINKVTDSIDFEVITENEYEIEE